MLCPVSHIRDFASIRRYLPLSVAKSIATALVTSRLDCCNSRFKNIAFKDITTLKRVQNCLAVPTVVTMSPRFTHSMPLLKSALVFVRYRVVFRICTISYLAFSGKCHSPNIAIDSKVNSNIGTMAFL